MLIPAALTLLGGGEPMVTFPEAFPDVQVFADAAMVRCVPVPEARQIPPPVPPSWCDPSRMADDPNCELHPPAAPPSNQTRDLMRTAPAHLAGQALPTRPLEPFGPDWAAPDGVRDGHRRRLDRPPCV